MPHNLRNLNCAVKREITILAWKRFTKIDFDYLFLWGHYRLVINLHEKLKGKFDDKFSAGINLNELGLIYSEVGETRKAIELHEQSLTINREIGSRNNEAVSLGNLGYCYSNLGETRKAIELHEQALTINREIGSRNNEAANLGNLGSCYAHLGETQKAIELHKQALTINREIGSHKNEAVNLGNLGYCYSNLGETRKAIELHEQALTINREIGSRNNEAVNLGNLGYCYSNLGETQKAIEFHEQALTINREIGNRNKEAVNLGNLGYCYSNLGETQKAIELHEQALTINREIGSRNNEATNLRNISNALLSLGEYKKAEENIKLALQIADEITSTILQKDTHYVLTKVYLFQNNLVNARATIEAALQYDVSQNNHNVTALHGIIALRQGERETAKEAFTKSIAQADEILAKTPDYYSALDAKGLALCGLALGRFANRPYTSAESAPTEIADAIETFQKARKIAPHAGVIKSVLRLFDELVKCDDKEILKDVRKAAEGVE